MDQRILIQNSPQFKPIILTPGKTCRAAEVVFFSLEGNGGFARVITGQ